VFGTDTFVGTYPANMLWTDMIWPLLLWRAADKLGNESTIAYEIAVDNEGPRITLDSPRFYLSKKQEGALLCSHPIDPLSNREYDDYGVLHRLQEGAKLPQLMFLRARVEDAGNHANGAEIVPVATVDESTVRLYVKPLDGTPLVTGSAGICRSINSALHDVAAYSGGSLEVVVANLEPIPPGGSGDFTPFVDAQAPAACDLLGDLALTEPPDLPCGHLSPMSQARYILGQRYNWSETAIFGIAPVVAGSDLKCEGIQFDARQLPDGWMCVAVAARDKLGNLGVSKPLRVCLDKQSTGVTACNSTPTLECSDPPDCEIPCWDPPNCLRPRPFTQVETVDLDSL
jgi:hypothetical protein